jgi:transposase
MGKRFKLVGPEELEEVEGALKKARDLRERQRLKAIRLGILGESTMEEVAGKVGVSRATIGTWAKKFRTGGMEAVLRTAFEERGRKGAIDAEVQGQIREKLATGDFKRAKELRSWLREKHGVELGLKAMYYWLGKVGGVLKVPRKTHARKDAAAAQAFKVDLADRLAKLGVPGGTRVRIWMADEHRYGLISVLRKVWTLRGHKPVAPYQTKYQWGHLYAALEVAGENSCEFFFSPTVSLEASDFFLRQVAESDETAHHIVIWDGAGFHQKPGSHPIPDRIHLLQLPAYSPELNPVEKLFDQLKDQIGNRLFDSLDDIEAAITILLSSFWSDLRHVASLIGNGWLLHQSNASFNPYRLVIN